ncbi:MAG TPA: response regulator transcription factor [Tepidisphaeraceae bacterium]|nr:response regulator transcription factor [Tepidisphaeraceae bacterium]
MERPRVLLAEDHIAVADRLRGLLEPDCEVVAVVHDGFAMLGAAQALAPDLVVTDIAMPGIDGIAATARIKAIHTSARVLVVSVHNDAALVQRAFDAGVSGYVLKIAAGDELPVAVKTVLAGKLYVSPQVRSLFPARRS